MHPQNEMYPHLLCCVISIITSTHVYPGLIKVAAMFMFCSNWQYSSANFSSALSSQQPILFLVLIQIILKSHASFTKISFIVLRQSFAMCITSKPYVKYSILCNSCIFQGLCSPQWPSQLLCISYRFLRELFLNSSDTLNIYFPYPNLIWQKLKDSLSSPAETAPAVLGRARKFHGLAEAL